MVKSLLCAVALAAASPLASAPHLVTDLNQGPNAEPQVALLPPGESATSIVYFPASDPAHGLELWRSDGTADGTYRLTDACPGRCSSILGPLTVFHGRLFFSADDGVSGAELWTSDGTPGSERRVRDLCPGPCGAAIHGFAPLGDRLLFATSTGESAALWRTDGTRSGTVRIGAFPSSPWIDQIFAPDGLWHAGGVLYFTINKTYSEEEFRQEIWRTDGTAAGTGPLRSFLPGFPSESSQLRQVGGVGLFWNGIDLWRTDFTAAGTWSLSARVPGLPVDFFDMFVVNGVALIRTSDALWRSDGTAAGTYQIFAAGGLGNASIRKDRTFNGLPVWNGALYTFWGLSLVRSDGTTAGTSVVYTFPQDLYPVDMVPLSGGLLISFSGRPNDWPSILWRTAGSAETTQPVAAFAGGAITGTAVLGGRALFQLSAGSGQGTWVSDGTPAGTREIAAVTGGPFTVAGGQALFASWGSSGGSPDLWRTDGTAAGTYPVHGFGAGPAGSGPLFQTVLGGKLLFSAQTGPLEAPLFVSDGTAAGTSILDRDTSWAGPFTHAGRRVFFPIAKRIEGPPGSPPALLPKGLGVAGPDGTAAIDRPFAPFSIVGAVDGRLLFQAGEPRPGPEGFVLYDAELWQSDGTGRGTFQVANIDRFAFTTGLHHACDTESSYPGPGVLVNGSLLFAAGDGVHGRELWATDGTRAGTRLVRDINSVRIPNQPDDDGCDHRTKIGLSSDPDGLVAFRRGVLFAADDGVAGRELWWSDGTDPGTRRVKDLLPGPAGGSPREMTPFGDAVYFFAAHPGGPGDALWRTDGTARGTAVVDDLTIGGAPSWARSLTAAGDRLFFAVDNEATGAELWTSRGTAASTGLAADLRPGPAGSYPQQLTAAGNVLVFAATDGVHGLEPWRSDGTAAGTRPLGDLLEGPGASSPGPFSRAGDDLLFGADDGVHGRELWAVPVSEVLKP